MTNGPCEDRFGFGFESVVFDILCDTFRDTFCDTFRETFLETLVLFLVKFDTLLIVFPHEA